MEQTELCDVGGNVWSRKNCVMWEGMCGAERIVCGVGRKRSESACNVAGLQCQGADRQGNQFPEEGSQTGP